MVTIPELKMNFKSNLKLTEIPEIELKKFGVVKIYFYLDFN